MSQKANSTQMCFEFCLSFILIDKNLSQRVIHCFVALPLVKSNIFFSFKQYVHYVFESKQKSATVVWMRVFHFKETGRAKRVCAEREGAACALRFTPRCVRRCEMQEWGKLQVRRQPGWHLENCHYMAGFNENLHLFLYLYLHVCRKRELRAIPGLNHCPNPRGD